MRARVNATGEVVTIMKNIGYPGGYVASNGRTYHDEELTLIVDEDPDYWERLEHQYAGMAMLGILSNNELYREICKSRNLEITIMEYAHALVEKYKKEE